MALFKKETIESMKDAGNSALNTLSDINEYRREVMEEKAQRKEEKREEKAQKKEDKEFAKAAKLLAKFGVEDLSDPRDVRAVKEIATEMSGKNMMQWATSMGGGNVADLTKMVADYNRVLVEQNFIIIRQLERLNRNMEKK